MKRSESHRGITGSRKKGKKACSYLLILLMAIQMAGCGEQESDGQEESKAREELVLWSYYETDAQRSGLDNLVNGFNQSQSQYRASWKYVPMTDFDKQLSRSYTEQSLPDMVLIDNPDMPVFIRLGIFEDITEQIESWNLEEEYYKAAVETVSLDGRYYGIPFICNNLGLIYNKEMLAEAQVDPPGTWDELRTAAKKLTAGERKGFLMSAVDSEQGAFQILPWILSAGEDPDQIGGEKTKEAFEFLNSCVEDGSMSNECINLTQIDVARKFIAGEAAMIENGPWILSMLQEAGIPYGITKLPVNRVSSMITGGENIGFIKGKNVEGSLKFFQYCMNGEVMESFCIKTGSLPAKIKKAKKVVKKDEQLSVFEEQMETALARTSIHSWSALSKQIPKSFYQMVSKEKTPEEAVKMLTEN